MDDNEGGVKLDLDSVPTELLGLELGRWMRAIDDTFAGAADDELIWAHVAALTGAMLLLKRLPGFDCDMAALRDLQVRLEKLTVGQKKPIMAVIDAVKVGHRPPESFFDHITQVRAVALVQAAIDRGWPQTEAYELVGRELARVRVQGRRGGEITARAVAAWHSEKIKQTDPVYREASVNFEELLPKDMPKSRFKQFARAFIQAGAPIRD